MNDAPQSAPDVTPEPARPGKRLADARAACGFSVADIARQLRLSPAQVESLESGDYQRLPGLVFVRGFMRNYARIVNLDPAPLIAGILQQVPEASAPALGLVHSVDIPFPTGREVPVKKYALAGLLVLVALGVYEFYPESDPESSAKSGQIKLSSPAVVVEENAAMPDNGAGQEPASVVPPAASDVAAPAPGEQAAPRTTVPGSPSTQVVPAPAEHKVKLNFDRDAWVEIRDRYGNRIFSQLSRAGTEQLISGLAPLSLVVGNAASVRLFHNDKRVDLAPYVKVDVARLTLE